MDRFQSNLKTIRMDRGITIDRLAKDTGIAVRTIILMEQDAGSNPQLATIQRLLRYLHISFEELYPQE